MAKDYTAPRTVFYVRLSSIKKKKDEDGKRLDEMDYENQIGELRERWGEQEIHSERVSGGKDRKVLKELVTTLPPGSTIHAVHLDRLSRQGVFNMGWMIEIARQRGVVIQTIHDGILTAMTKEQELLIAIKALNAQSELTETQRRVRAAIKERKKLGLKWGAQIASERGTHARKGPAKNPLWQTALPRLQELHRRGHSINEIVRIASEEFGQPFSRSHVHRLLNPKKEAG